MTLFDIGMCYGGIVVLKGRNDKAIAAQPMLSVARTGDEREKPMLNRFAASRRATKKPETGLASTGDSLRMDNAAADSLAVAPAMEQRSRSNRRHWCCAPKVPASAISSCDVTAPILHSLLGIGLSCALQFDPSEVN